MTETDQKQDLLNAAQAAVADAKAKAGARTGAAAPVSRTREIVTVAGLVLTLAGFALAAFRPAWFLTPPPEPEPPVIQEASARLTLAREAQRINGWRRVNGRLPVDLAEAGTPVAGLSYERINDSVFAVSLPLGTDLVTLRSTDSLSTFIGGAVGTVAARGGR
ncbi:MAG TPA: hypothetical protein VF862_08410 [Gemmatimonadales bacterium]